MNALDGLNLAWRNAEVYETTSAQVLQWVLQTLTSLIVKSVDSIRENTVDQTIEMLIGLYNAQAAKHDATLNAEEAEVLFNSIARVGFRAAFPKLSDEKFNAHFDGEEAFPCMAETVLPYGKTVYRASLVRALASLVGYNAGLQAQGWVEWDAKNNA